MTVRLTISVAEPMEFVHLKDMRASGMEPIDAISGYCYADRLGYYRVTKDAATHFFFDYLPKGKYTLVYRLRAFHAGKYRCGIEHLQCMYAPEFNAHSGSVEVTVVR